MDKNDLEVGKPYKTTANVKVCFYDKDDCLMPDMVDLQIGTKLTYVGPDNDPDGGYVFQDMMDNTKFCFHDDDLASVEES